MFYNTVRNRQKCCLTKASQIAAALTLGASLIHTPHVYAAAKIVEKKYCGSAFTMQSADKSRQALLIAAKREAVHELFGEFITSSTIVENSRLTRDQIQSASVGLIRVQGNVEFFNGNNFGEVCASLTAVATDEDFAQFRPVRVSKKYCATDPQLTTANLKETARKQARVQALVQYEPKLQSFTDNLILPLFKRWRIMEEGFVQDTETFCARLEGDIIPIEIPAFLRLTNKEIGTKKTNAEPEANKPRLNGNYQATYKCEGTVRGEFSLKLVNGSRVEGIFTWWSPKKNKVYGVVKLSGDFDSRTRSAELRITNWLKNGGGRYSGSTVKFSKSYNSLYAEHNKLRNCSNTYHKN